MHPIIFQALVLKTPQHPLWAQCHLFAKVPILKGKFGVQEDTAVQFHKWFNELADRGLIPRGPG